jgi:hypothetical protein
MKLSSTTARGLSSLLLGTVLLCTGCEPKGPAERAGEKIDQGIQNVKDTVDPAGPAEKAGEAVDRALNR